jgi:hypothetical protein
MQHRGIAIQQRSIGGYLTTLSNHATPGVGRITQVERQNYQFRIVVPRNRYLHQAGANPAGVHEIKTLLSEMQACFARVLNL